MVNAGNREGEGPQARALRRSEDGGNRERLRVVEGQARQLVRGGIDIVKSAHIDPHDRGPHLEVEHAWVVVEARHLDHRIGFDAAGIEIDTAPILIGGGFIVVPCGGVGTSGHFQLVADPVSIRVVVAVAKTILKWRRIRAAAIVIVGGVVVVAGRRVGTSAVEAGPVVHCRAGVVVVGRGVGTTAGAGTVGALKAQVETEVALPHTVFEDLNEERARNLSVRCQLCQQDPLIGIRHTIAVVLGDKPCAARRIVHHNVAARFKRRQPALRGAFHRAHLTLSRGAIRLLRDANGHPAVVRQLGEEAEEQGVDRIGCSGTKGVLVKGRRGGQIQRKDGITTHGRDDVVGIHAVHEDMVRGHAGEGAGIVFGNDIHGQAVAGDLGMRNGQRGHAKEKSDQTVHVSTIWVGQS